MMGVWCSTYERAAVRKRLGQIAARQGEKWCGRTGGREMVGVVRRPSGEAYRKDMWDRW